MASRYRQRGFTLIELITVIVLLGALAGITAVFLVQPFQAAADISRRAGLVDEADLALSRIGREVRTALPNSVRVTSDGSGRSAVEFVSTRTGGRYRRVRNGSGNGQVLTPSDPAGTFDVLGALPEWGISHIDDNSGLPGSADCARGNRYCISIYNTGQSDLDIYDEDNDDGNGLGGDNLAAITDTGGATPTATSRIMYDNGSPGTAAFETHSPRQRFFVVDDVVSYVCDTNSGTLRRRATYGLKSTQPIAPGDFSGASNAISDLLAGDVAACNFAYQSGDSSRAGLLTLSLRLQRGGETVELLKQAHVMNAP